ncbi:MAG TPA: OsmC family protein [Anaeromyxobacteraceae bacterium]|nr:OsmC family protein [Anaeromyxobacteraceae bacterium]
MPAAHVAQSIDRVVAYLSEHPDKARSSDKAATAIVEEGLRCRARAPDGATVHSDMPKSIGGGGSAPSPAWLLRAALACCDATVIALRAAQLGVALAELEVTVDSESDDRGMLGMDGRIPAGPLSMRTRVRIGAPGVPPERLREIVEWAEAHSPVGDAIRRAVPATTVIEIP